MYPLRDVKIYRFKEKTKPRIVTSPKKCLVEVTPHVRVIVRTRCALASCRCPSTNSRRRLAQSQGPTPKEAEKGDFGKRPRWPEGPSLQSLIGCLPCMN